MYMLRTRFKKDIVAEFMPPLRKGRPGRVIILLDGMPAMPSKQTLAEFLALKGFWVIHPRLRGTWESGGRFLKIPPEKDLVDILDELPRGLREIEKGRKFALKPREIYVIGVSFGGAGAILSTLDSRVTKAVAICPVVDWSKSRKAGHKQFGDFIRRAFGEGYRYEERDWNKLLQGRFYNPAQHIGKLDPKKMLLFHAKDDRSIPWKFVADFARKTGAKLHLYTRGGHLPMNKTVRTRWNEIRKFLKPANKK